MADADKKIKVNKKQLVSQFKDKIIGEWAALSYDEIRKEIFRITEIEVNNYDIQTYVSKNGLSSSRRHKNKKIIENIFKHIDPISCGYNQIRP